MKSHPYALTAIYLVAAILIGVPAILLPLNGIECYIVSSLQSFAQKTIGIQAFQVLTYLGDFYLWVIFSVIYFFYAYFRSRKYLSSAAELAVFLVITTALTYLLKEAFARPRPYSVCSDIAMFAQEDSFSYPSGHVSRATGAFLILSGKNKAKESLATAAIFLVSLCRIILGVHYPTDIVGGIFLSLAAQNLANLIVPFLKLETTSNLQQL